MQAKSGRYAHITADGFIDMELDATVVNSHFYDEIHLPVLGMAFVLDPIRSAKFGEDGCVFVNMDSESQDILMPIAQARDFYRPFAEVATPSRWIPDIGF